MILPPGCICLDGVKPSTNETDDFQPTRSMAPIANTTDETLATSAPTKAAADSRVSDDVCTVALAAPAAAAPILNPLIVMVKGSAAMLAPDVFKTMNVSVKAIHRATRLGTLVAFGAIQGVTDELSKPGG